MCIENFVLAVAAAAINYSNVINNYLDTTMRVSKHALLGTFGGILLMSKHTLVQGLACGITCANFFDDSACAGDSATSNGCTKCKKFWHCS